MLSPLRDRTARLRLSLYPDDMAVVVNPIKADVDMVMQIMERFGQATCLRINTQEYSRANKMLSSEFRSSVAEFFWCTSSFSNHVSGTATMFGSITYGTPAALS
jgi:hypothetical protein